MLRHSTILLVLSSSLLASPKDFFERRIRPVLIKECYRCHSGQAKRVKGGLRLDTKADLRKGGESGPILIPGKPEKSRLIQALRHKDLKMPPSRRLPDSVLADFEQWVRIGAPDPRSDKAVTQKGIDWEKARRHWAYQPIRKPDLPQVKNQQWARNPIDLFILAQQVKQGLKPAPDATARELLRRMSYDLVGLPPTFEEVQKFEEASKKNPQLALEQAIERLLNSPRYGERWGRHWLDVARFAETKDLVLLYGRNRIHPYAYTFRDYVIKALNIDTPYDRFLKEQLVADQLDLKGEKWRLAAMGFLTLGRMFCNMMPDVFDDQIDTVTRGMLGLTVSCARCHDHKYDAIPTADYYSLYGIFAGSERPINLPLIEEPSTIPGGEALEKRLQAKRAELQRHIDQQYKMLTEMARTRVGEYLNQIATKPKDPLEVGIFFLSLSPNDLRPQTLARWRAFLNKHSENDPLFGLWHELLAIPEKDLKAKAPAVLKRWRAKKSSEIRPLLRRAIENVKIESRAGVARLYGKMFRDAYEAHKKGITPTSLSESGSRNQLLKILMGERGPVYFPRRSTYLYMSRVPRGAYHSKLLDLDKIALGVKRAPARAMTLIDSPEQHVQRVFIRGNPRRPGKPVPRRFLQVISKKTFSKGSGRLELAESITSSDNPLTARVMVNRVWMHHFGKPLVSTPNDFGARSDPPTHPKLLDYLAWCFQDSGYSLKRLHRMIMLSRTYQQSTRHNARDLENRYWTRMNRRRLDLEQMRDTMLLVSGRLDSQMHGPSMDLSRDAKNRRRTIYGLIDRQDLPGLYRAFDFASPDQSAGQRPSTTVPQQALFGMSSPFMIEQVKALAKRVKGIRGLYRVVFAREPSEEEVELGRRFLSQPRPQGKASSLSPMEQYAQVLLLTNEMMFID